MRPATNNADLIGEPWHRDLTKTRSFTRVAERSPAEMLAFGDAAFDMPGAGPPLSGSFLGVGASRLRAWTIVDGRDLAEARVRQARC